MKYKFEIVRNDPNIPGRILMQDKPGWRCRTSLHWHSELELVYMIHGCMNAKINGKEYSIHDGEFYFCNHEDLHINSSPDKESVQQYLVVLLSYEELKRYEPDLDKYVFSVNGNDSVREEIACLMEKLVDYEQNQPPCSDILKNQIILQLYYIFLTRCLTPKPEVVSTAAKVRYAKEVIAYIREHYREKITIEMLADEICLSPQYLSKHFKNITHMTLSEYLSRYRLEQANKYLLNEYATVTEAALENGFPNVKAYITTCKKIYGITPAEYRKIIMNAP